MSKTFITTLILALLISCTTKQNNESTIEADETSGTMLKSDKKPMSENTLPVISGVYNNGLLSLASDGNLVTGFYANGRYEGNPKFGCSFYFFGNSSDQLEARKIKIKILNPFSLTEKPRAGTFKLHDEEDDIFSLVANLNADDCWDSELGFTEIGTAPGIGFELATEKPWLEIRIASTDRVYFYDSVNEQTRRKAYVINGDPLFIGKIEGEWMMATYIGQKSARSGWIKKADTKSLPDIAKMATD
jgi:hypothetical protein